MQAGWFHFHKTLEKCKILSRARKQTSFLLEATPEGIGGRELLVGEGGGRETEGNVEIYGYFHYVDYRDGFSGLYIYQKGLHLSFSVCNVLCVNYPLPEAMYSFN